MNNYDQVRNDPLALVIVQITNAMKADFGRQYQVQFKTNEDLTQYKRRLYTKLRAFDINDIANGYESYIDSGKTFCPTVPDLLECVEEEKKRRIQREQAATEVHRVATLPPPTIQCDPLKMLADAKQAAQQRKDGPSMGERLVAHNALLTLHSKYIKKREFGSEKCCEVGYCKKPGAFSHNTKGGGPFYCLEHYRQAG